MLPPAVASFDDWKRRNFAARTAPHTAHNVELWIAAFETTLAVAAEDADMDPDAIASDIAHYAMIEPPAGYDFWDPRTEAAARRAVL